MRRYLTRRCIGLHVTLLILVPTFVWLTRWQLSRALGGNTLSWAYTFEWPLFGVYAVYVWWQLIHDQPTAVSRRMLPSSDGAAGGPGDDGPTAEYNQPGWALSGGRPKNVAVAASHVIDEEAGGRGERFAPQTPEEAAELAEYNRYLAELNATDAESPRR